MESGIKWRLAISHVLLYKVQDVPHINVFCTEHTDHSPRTKRSQERKQEKTRMVRYHKKQDVHTNPNVPSGQTPRLKVLVQCRYRHLDEWLCNALSHQPSAFPPPIILPSCLKKRKLVTKPIHNTFDAPGISVVPNASTLSTHSSHRWDQQIISCPIQT